MKLNRRFWILTLTLLFTVFVVVSVYAAAAFTGIKKGETINRSWFGAGETVSNEGTVKGDIACAGRDVMTSGTVEGDMIAAGQNLFASGTVGGDLLAGAGNINSSANVAGDMRVGAGNIIVEGNIGKNVNLFAGTVNVKNTTTVGGNMMVFAGDVKIDGKVKGYTRIEAENVILNGEFFGDVDINTGYKENNDNNKMKLTVLPGTVIHGKLKYIGPREADIQNGAAIGSFEWVKPDFQEKMAGKKAEERNAAYYVWKLIKILFTTAVYFLIAMLFYKLFPSAFMRQGKVIEEKPWKVLGVGFLAAISTVGALIVFIILLCLTFIISPSVGLVFGAAAALAYIVLFYLSTIPVSMWLGNVLAKDKHSIPKRFAIGLFTFTTGLFLIGLLTAIPFVGPIFSILLFLTAAAAFIIGTGALLFGINNICVSANRE